MADLCCRGRALVWITVLVLSPGLVVAGGYLAVDTTGQPYRWSGPIQLRFDLGLFSVDPIFEEHVTNDQGDALVRESMERWTDPLLTRSAVLMTQGPDLTEDHGDGQGSDPQFTGLDMPPDGITPVIYDQNGTIINSLFGSGSGVIGFAGPEIPADFSPAPITEGLVVINGSASRQLWSGALTHELGHLLNLDHSQARMAFFELSLTGIPSEGADFRGIPTMFPLAGTENHSLEEDDKAWIAALYPGAAYGSTGKITGIARDNLGQPLNNVNIVAQKIDDPLSLISCVSGYNDPTNTDGENGEFAIPSLPTGSGWILDVEPVSSLFAGSSIGNTSPSTALALPGPIEFVNEAEFESGGDNPNISTTFKVSLPGQVISGVELQFNDLADFETITEVDNGISFNQATSATITPGRFNLINGTANMLEPGAHEPGIYLLAITDQGIVFRESRVVDWYVVTPPAGIELNQVYMTASAPRDLFIGGLDNTDTFGIFSMNSGTAVAEELFIDNSQLGGGARQGKIYIGVGGDPAWTDSATYVVGILTSVSSIDPVAVDGPAGGSIDPTGTVRINGTGFKNGGGTPIVTMTNPNVQVTSVAFVSPTALDVTVSTLPGFVPGSTTGLDVRNRYESGGFGGRRRNEIPVTSASPVTDWRLY